MRRIGPILMMATAGSLLAGGVLAQVNDPVEREILSSEDGALLPPEEWACNLYVDEYEAFLKAGNQPDSWRFVGKRYRSSGDNRAYDWQQWLAWYEEADCAARPIGEVANSTGPAGGGGGGASGGSSGGLFGGDMTAVGIVGGMVVTGLIAAGAGGGGDSDNKSPG